jgi:small subunit ribosomal protein S8
MDIIGNALTKIRNALMRGHPFVDVQKTNLVEDILEIMKREGYIEDFKSSDKSKYGYTVALKYHNGKPAVDGLKRVSKLSRRLYVGKDKIPSVYNNYGIAIISTSKGVLTDKEARSLGVGGEVLCYIW